MRKIKIRYAPTGREILAQTCYVDWDEDGDVHPIDVVKAAINGPSYGARDVVLSFSLQH